MSRSRAVRRFVGAYRLMVPVGLAILVLNALAGPASGPAADVLFLSLLVVAAVATGLRARAGPSPGAWWLATVGLTLWAAAEFVYRVTQPDPTAYYPLATQLLLAGAFAAAYGTLVLLARERIRRFDPVLALDGAIAGLTAAAAVAVWLIPAGTEAGANGGPAAGPLLAALGGLWFVIVVLGLTGWRPGWAWGMITLGIALNVAGAAVQVQLLDAGEWRRGSIADPLLVCGAVLLGMAALLPLRGAEKLAIGPRRLPIPLGCGALALLLVSALGDVGLAATLLAAAALAFTLARMTVALNLVERTRSEARTDPLTQLGNRRRLLDDLELRLADPDAAPFTLALFDLDGFKAYNDRFGHLGGDALLERLARHLADAVQPGRAFRMGGDEFCAVIDGVPEPVQPLLCRARAALTERGDGFLITASCGCVHCPDEARTATAALQLADTRMYADKETADRQPTVLPLVAGRRRPPVADPLRDVGPMAAEVARRLGLDTCEARLIERAAELRDIGKIAVPEEILLKPGRLDDDEWRLVRQHTVIGERILRVAPALAELAPLVRASHERFDGEGYPDGLRGDEIPLGGRIVAVCDAYHAMVHRAAHHEARSPLDALRELRAGAGTQFDPRVVSAFGAALRERVNVEAALAGQRGR